jgi:dTDP-4-amino-4,6-dideoxygalactose transaminase
MGRRYHDSATSLPVAEAATDRLVRLPMYNDMTDDEVAVVVDAVTTWRQGTSR